jgi:small subunit ribosomal protein S20
MANNPSAEKRIRQNSVRRERNRSARSKLRTAVKKLRKEVEAGNKEGAEALLGPTLSLVDATAQKKIIHRNAAARTKSRLTRAVNGLD